MYAARFAVKDFFFTETAGFRKSEWRFASQFQQMLRRQHEGSQHTAEGFDFDWVAEPRRQ